MATGDSIVWKLRWFIVVSWVLFVLIYFTWIIQTAIWGVVNYGY